MTDKSDKPRHLPEQPSTAHLIARPGSGPTPEQQRKETARRKGRRTREWWKQGGE